MRTLRFGGREGWGCQMSGMGVDPRTEITERIAGRLANVKQERNSDAGDSGTA